MFFSKERPFCSKLHEAAYHDELSAMNRLVEFTLPTEQPALPAPRKRTLSEIYRESKINWALSTAVPPLCNLVEARDRPVPVTPHPAALLLEAAPFAGPIQFPSSSQDLIAFTLNSATEPAPEMTAHQTMAGCGVPSKPRRRVPPRNPTAFGLRTHRRRMR
jgi:hypothetical protein